MFTGKASLIVTGCAIKKPSSREEGFKRIGLRKGRVLVVFIEACLQLGFG
jgi:hypothetical protein